MTLIIKALGAECCYAESFMLCVVLLTVMLNIVMLSITMINVVLLRFISLNVIILNVVAPTNPHWGIGF